MNRDPRRFRGRAFVLLLLLLALLALPLPASAVQPDGAPNLFGPFTARIRLEIQADDEAAVRSYLSRELRELSGVKLTDEDPEYVLEVVILETHNRGGMKTGYAASVVALSVWRQVTVRNLLTGVPEQSRKLIEPLMAGSGFIAHHVVLTGPDLKEICQRIVAGFDGDVLEPARQRYQKLVDAYEELESSREEPADK